MYSKKKMIKIDFAYTSLLSFYNNLKYNNSRSLSINSLDSFIKVFPKKLYSHLQAVIPNFNDYKEDSIREENRNKLIKVYYDHDVLINNYGELFDFTNEQITLKDNISLEVLEELIDNLNPDIYTDAIFVSSYDSECKETLGINLIKNRILEYVQNEIRLELLYDEYIKGDIVVIEEINRLKRVRNDFLGEIISKGIDFIDFYSNESSSLIDERIQIPIDYYPVDTKYELYEVEDNFIDEIISDPYMYAIFYDFSLAYFRISHNLDYLISYSIELDEDKDLDKSLKELIKKNNIKKGGFTYSVIPDWELAFYMSYIKKLNEIQNEFGINEKLQKSIARLMYILDDSALNLLDEKSFNKQYSKIKIDECDFSWWETLIMVSIMDIFEREQDETEIMKKIALISTYYSLTNEEEILVLLGNYTKNPNYKKYMSFIRGKTLQK